MKINFKSILYHALFILGIIIFNIILWFPQFEGKVVGSTDLVQAVSMQTETIDYLTKTGKPAFWTNSMFGGMPTFQIFLFHEGNLMMNVKRFFQLFLTWPAGLFISGMISMYLMMIMLRTSRTTALVSSIIFAITAGNFILFEAGHVNKLETVLLSPFILGGLILGFQKNYLFGAIVFGFGMALSVASSHPQMTYYLGLCLFVFTLAHLVESLIKKEFTHLFKLGVPFIVALILGVGTLTSSYWTTYDYAKETMRGGSILQPEQGSMTATQNNSKGLDWDYAMNWSNGTKDVLASFIPKIVGGGSGEWVEKNTKLAKDLGQNKSFQVGTYWGDLPSTSGPVYLGAVALTLFFLGFFILKGNIKYWMGGAVLFTFLLSMGKFFPWLNRPMFDYFPMFSKFRAPSSTTSITILFIALQAGLVLDAISKTEDKETLKKPIILTLSILGGFALLIWLIGGFIFSFEGSGDANYANIIEPLIDYRKSMLSSSALRSLGFVIVTLGLIFAFMKNYISANILSAIIGFLCLADALSISNDYLNSRNWISKRQNSESSKPRPVDEAIMADKELNYRVLDVTINTFNDASSSVFHKTIGGYSPVKLQRIQDLIERHISKNNMNVLNMLNTKYFIVQGADGQPAAQQNPGALGPAWFVDSIQYVTTPDEEIAALNTINPSNTAVIHQEFKPILGGLDPIKSGEIKMTEYSPNKLEYQYSSNSEQVAVLSEMWYGPNKGWKAYVNDKEVELIRANYALRALKLPAASNAKIVLEFKPQTYFIGTKINLICSVLLLLSAAFAIAYYFKYNRLPFDESKVEKIII